VYVIAIILPAAKELFLHKRSFALLRTTTDALTLILGALGRLIYHAGLHPLVIRFNRRAVRVLLYHDCAPVETPYTAGLSVTIPPAAFAAHMQYVSKHYRTVSLKDLVGMRGGASDRLALVSFDDGYRSVYEHALPVLRRLELPAAVFLVTSSVGNRKLVWVNELNWHLQRQRAAALAALAWLPINDQDDSSHIIQTALAHYDAAAIERTLVDLAATAGIDRVRLAETARLYVTWDEARELDAAGITLGNHTATHANLTRLSDDAIRRELQTAAAALTAEVGGGVGLAYPFGAVNDRVRAIARQMNDDCLLEVAGDTRRHDPLRIARCNVTSTSVAGLFAELEVVQPTFARLAAMKRFFKTKPAIANLRRHFGARPA
jgi:peptidoglycan/xylan/chitin deacetylase (PgdA/CDA1 family)